MYPLPEPLVKRLKAGILFTSSPSQEEENGAGTATDSSNQLGTPPAPHRRRLVANGAAGTGAATQVVLVEDANEALAQLVGNSIEAMDAMYFSAPARVRRHPSFQHRLCLRIQMDPSKGTLSITDLGAGMTRADLINSLGISRAALLSSPTTSEPKSAAVGSVTGGRTQNGAHPPHSNQLSRSDTDSTDEDEDPMMFDDDLVDGELTPSRTLVGQPGSKKAYANGSRAAPSAAVPANSSSKEEVAPVLSCRTSELGGFYAALCSLGTGVRVGTKSKHDDYYEFEVGVVDDNNGDGENKASFLESFVVRRPLPEGSALTAESGFGGFSDVRGESGTRVTIWLNAESRKRLLDEAALRPIFLNLLQTTQYTVAFSSDPGAQAVIDASALEASAMESLLREPEDPLDAVADMDLASKVTARGKGQEGDAALTGGSSSYNSVRERAKYIPLRLSLGERKMLRLVEAAMCCCEYTTEVDRPFKSAARRTHEQLKGVTSILRGLVTACDYSAGQKLQEEDNFADYEGFFRNMFEIARRHKIMNPEKMRTEYGKLIYLLQDAVSPSVRPHLGFSVKGPISSVYKFLDERGAVELLSDPLIETATREILAEKKSRATIDHEIRQKERAVGVIKRKYKNHRLSTDDIHLCLYSICDNNSFLNSNRVPIDKIIDYLTSHFSPTQVEDGYSLSIVSGEDGARLSHSHERQYFYALQSLTLWRDIIDDMFRLWAMAEDDLLSESVSYSLQDTGQGMHRVQQSPRTYQAMQRILQRVQQKVSHWVGSSVIHMGDHNVPNALSFIDKYTQGASSNKGSTNLLSLSRSSS
jgi:hypothetical protein